MSTVHFEDHGQDFLEWDIERQGKLHIVVDSRPFQSSIWRGSVVRNFPLHIGDCVDIQLRGESITIKYPLVAVKRSKKGIRK